MKRVEYIIFMEVAMKTIYSDDYISIISKLRTIRLRKKIKIITSFKGTDYALIQELTDINFSVQKCSFRDL